VGVIGGISRVRLRVEFLLKTDSGHPIFFESRVFIEN